MKIEVKKLSEVKRVIKVEVEETRLKKDRERVYKDLARELKVPGFRKGCAPVEVLEKHFGDFLKEKFLEWALPAYYEKVIEENKFIPVSLPRIFDVELKDDKLSFSVEVEVKPQIEISEEVYKGIKLKEKKIEVSEKEIEKLISIMQEDISKIVGRKIDEEYVARWYGYKDIDSFKEALKNDIKNEKLEERRRDLENQIISYLLKKIKVEVPPKAAGEFLERVVEREIKRLELQGFSSEDLNKYRQDLEKKLKPYTFERIKLFYILEAIAQKENLKVDKDSFYDVVMNYILSFAQYT